MAIAGTVEAEPYLTFKLDTELFALDIDKVREVLDVVHIAKLPRTPEFMRGVINLRGTVVPVIDLRLKLGMSKTQQTVDTCVIITEATVDNDVILLGLLADSVQEVIDLDSDNIEASSRLGTRVNTGFIKGMGMREKGFIIILDIDKIFCVDAA